MISKIQKLKNWGIFQDYLSSSTLQPFKKYNVFYGWNGSGKTTLSKLFRCLEKKVLDETYINGEFEILLEDGTKIKHKDLISFSNKIFVFNQNFIEENIDWQQQGAKNIVIISEHNIEDRNQHSKIKNDLLPSKEREKLIAENTLKASEKERDDFLTSEARNLKQSFQLIDTKDKRYLNYDRTKLKDFIQKNETQILSQESILTIETLQQLQQKLHPFQKAKIDYIFPIVDYTKIIEGGKRIKNLLSSSIVNDGIERLQKHSDINHWVEQGINIHKIHNSTSCEFCGQSLPQKRIETLEKHFNTAYLELINKIENAQKWLDTLWPIYNIPDEKDLYDELQTNYKRESIKLKEQNDKLNSYWEQWKTYLQKKLNNPFLNDSILPDANLEIELDLFNEIQSRVEQLIETHNKKTENFENELILNKELLELHYVSSSIKEKNYYQLVNRIYSEEQLVESITEEIINLKTQLISLDKALANARIGADKFNDQLHSFLGRKDISLEYDSQLKGYRIIRTGSSTPAKNLSEGEKTAIAFIYFMIKLKENGNLIEDSIIVVDDPISSFDSNHLFHAFAFLKGGCENALQLFILTHNFQYFKLIRDWILKKNKKEQKSVAYTIETDKKSGSRTASLVNAHPSLIDHNSEYHFLFKKLYEFKELSTLNTEDSYQIANFSRKMLEAFFTFKYPKKRNDFASLMEFGCQKANIDDAKKEKIYRFINKYSHYQVIDFFDSSLDNLLGEGDNIVNDIFEIIECSDKIHYDEMIGVCTGN